MNGREEPRKTRNHTKKGRKRRTSGRPGVSGARTDGSPRFVRVRGPRVTVVQQRTRCGSIKADPAHIWPEATPKGASVSSDRRAPGHSRALCRCASWDVQAEHTLVVWARTAAAIGLTVAVLTAAQSAERSQDRDAVPSSETASTRRPRGLPMFNPFTQVAKGRPTDAELVEKAKSGDRTALEQLVLRHQAWVCNIAVRMVFHPGRRRRGERCRSTPCRGCGGHARGPFPRPFGTPARRSSALATALWQSAGPGAIPWSAPRGLPGPSPRGKRTTRPRSGHRGVPGETGLSKGFRRWSFSHRKRRCRLFREGPHQSAGTRGRPASRLTVMAGRRNLSCRRGWAWCSRR
jgi:hypothetical protein